jgi:SAM-dependent methyltransferase
VSGGREAPETEAVGCCPACGSSLRRERFRSRDWIHLVPGEFPLMQCGRCAAIYPDPRPTAGALSQYYPESEYYAYSAPSRHRLFGRRTVAARAWYTVVRGLLETYYNYPMDGSRRAAQVAARLSPVRARATFRLGVLLHPWQPGGALLDVGCGSGRYLDLMRALGWPRTVGVDLSRAAVAAAKSLGVEAHLGELREVGFAEATFDAVSLSHTLEHVANPVGLLEEVRRVAKPGARIAIVVPNVESMSSRVFGERWVGWEAPRHLVNFSRTALARVLDAAGLRVETLTTSAAGVHRTALFSLSRHRGDPYDTYVDDGHRFGPVRQVQAAAVSAGELARCSLGKPAGELLTAVARA